jgi:hypothetical protein
MPYASFMVRLWREEGSSAEVLGTDWQSEIQHIQSGRSWAFATLDELLEFLRQQAEEPELLRRPESDE